MKKRVAAVVVGLLYLSVAVVFGMLHDHRDAGALYNHHECAACVWHVSAATDVPLSPVLAAGDAVAAAAFSSQTVVVPAVFSLSSASRAPPIIPA